MQTQNEIAGRVLIMAMAVAVPLAVLCGFLAIVCPSVLTSNAAVSGIISAIGVQGALSILFCSVDCGCEGILVAQGRLKFLAGSMAAVLAVVALYFTACWRGNCTLSSVWWGLVLFFALRCALSTIAVVPGILATWQRPLVNVAL